jgi:hypothetical protein
MERKSIFKLLALCCLALALSGCTGSPTQGTTAASPSVSQSWVAGGAEGRINAAVTELSSIIEDLTDATSAGNLGELRQLSLRFGPVASIIEQESLVRVNGDAEMSGYLSNFASNVRRYGDTVSDINLSYLRQDRSGLTAGADTLSGLKGQFALDGTKITTWFANHK